MTHRPGLAWRFTSCVGSVVLVLLALGAILLVGEAMARWMPR